MYFNVIIILIPKSAHIYIITSIYCYSHIHTSVYLFICVLLEALRRFL
jgi:hypothetical protein